MANKKSYNKPQLTIHGAVEALTEQTSTGTKIDQSFPAGTSLSVILSSGVS
jgi:hypothetical protein